MNTVSILYIVLGVLKCSARATQDYPTIYCISEKNGSVVSKVKIVKIVFLPKNVDFQLLIEFKVWE